MAALLGWFLRAAAARARFSIERLCLPLWLRAEVGRLEPELAWLECPLGGRRCCCFKSCNEPEVTPIVLERLKGARRFVRLGSSRLSSSPAELGFGLELMVRFAAEWAAAASATACILLNQPPLATFPAFLFLNSTSTT